MCDFFEELPLFDNSSYTSGPEYTPIQIKWGLTHFKVSITYNLCQNKHTISQTASGCNLTSHFKPQSGQQDPEIDQAPLKLD